MAQKKIIICDTNILIEVSKNNSEIISELKVIGLNRIAVSSVTVGEFIFGALNTNEMAKIKKALRSIQILHVNETISKSSIQMLEKYTLAYNLDVPDSLIGATALFYNLELYTLNVKDFRFIEGLNLYEKSIQF